MLFERWEAVGSGWGPGGMWVKACINGSRRRGDHPALPTTPDAMAREAAAAVRAGALAVHLHARDASGTESLAAADVGACVAAVRRAVPGVPVGVSTGLWIHGGDADARAADVAAWSVLDRAVRPDFASVNLSEPGASHLWDVLAGLGVGVEPGVWSPADADRLAAMLAAAPARPGAVPRVLLEVVAAPAGKEVALAGELLGAARRRLPPDLPLLLHGEDDGAWPVLALAAREGVQTRIGLEDVLTGPTGEPVAGTAELVRAALALSASGGPARRPSCH